MAGAGRASARHVTDMTVGSGGWFGHCGAANVSRRFAAFALRSTAPAIETTLDDRSSPHPLHFAGRLALKFLANLRALRSWRTDRKPKLLSFSRFIRSATLSLSISPGNLTLAERTRYFFCRTLQMSHGRAWRDSCVSTRRDKHARWLWRLVRHFVALVSK